MSEKRFTPKKKSPAGRRAGDSGTRAAVLDAARDLFAERGYEGASVRAIAARAGVDPGLIRHFFNDKETLFVTTMADRSAIPERLAAALAGDPETVGLRITDAYLCLWEEADTRPILLGLVRSAMTSEYGAEQLVEVFSGRILRGNSSPIADPAKIRGRVLALSHLFGVAVARNVLHLPALCDIPHDELVATVGPVVQTYLTMD